MTFSLLCWCCALVFRNGVCADRSGMVASRFLTAAAVCEIFLSSAAEIHKSYCSDCMKVANGALAADFFHFGVDDVPFKIPFKKCLKIIAFPLGRRDPVLELQFV